MQEMRKKQCGILAVIVLRICVVVPRREERRMEQKAGSRG